MLENLILSTFLDSMDASIRLDCLNAEIQLGNTAGGVIAAKLHDNPWKLVFLSVG